MALNKKYKRKFNNASLSKKEQLQSLLQLPEVHSWRTLMTAFKTIYSKLEKELMAEGCTISRFQILLHLYFEGTLPAITISKKMLVTRGNVTMFLRRLESDGLIKPLVLKGQKRPVYMLTKQGENLFEKLFTAHIMRVQKLCPSFDPIVLTLLGSISEPF